MIASLFQAPEMMCSRLETPIGCGEIALLVLVTQRRHHSTIEVRCAQREDFMRPVMYSWSSCSDNGVVAESFNENICTQ